MGSYDPDVPSVKTPTHGAQGNLSLAHRPLMDYGSGPPCSVHQPQPFHTYPVVEGTSDPRHADRKPQSWQPLLSPLRKLHESSKSVTCQRRITLLTLDCSSKDYTSLNGRGTACRYSNLGNLILPGYGKVRVPEGSRQIFSRCGFGCSPYL